MAGKKILTQFALPVGSTSGDFGNGTAGQVLATGGDSASMYWATTIGTAGNTSIKGKAAGLVTLTWTSGTLNRYYTKQHNLGTQDIMVSVRTHFVDADGGSDGYTVAQRFATGVDEGNATIYPGRILDQGHDFDVISCDSTGAMSNNHVTFDFYGFRNDVDSSGTYSKYLFYTIIG